MNKALTLLFLSGILISCTKEPAQLSVTSPNGINSIDFHLSEDGTPYYFVNHNDKIVVDSSSMSFDFKNQESLKDGLSIINSTTNTNDETWEMPWGEQKDVVNNYNELVVELEETPLVVLLVPELDVLMVSCNTDTVVFTKSNSII